MCLPKSLSPRTWYRLLNSKVFFWASRDRLNRLLRARHYRANLHDVLVIDTAKLLNDFANKIHLCRMNSGNTFPIPHLRDKGIFKRIEEYPTSKSGLPRPPIAEVVVDLGIQNMERYVVDVRSMRAGEDCGSIL